MAAPPPMDLTPILVAAQSPDAGVRQAAEGQLTALRASNPPAFLYALAAELAAEAKPPEARQIAGLILKNALDAPSESKKVRGSRRLGKRRGTGSRLMGAPAPAFLHGDRSGASSRPRLPSFHLSHAHPLSLSLSLSTGRARRPVAGPGRRGQGGSAAPAAEHAGVAGEGEEEIKKKRPHGAPLILTTTCHPIHPRPSSSLSLSLTHTPHLFIRPFLPRSPPPPRRPPWSSPRWLPPTCPPGRGRNWCPPCWRPWRRRPRPARPRRPRLCAPPPWKPWATCARRWGGGRMTSWSRRYERERETRDRQRERERAAGCAFFPSLSPLPSPPLPPPPPPSYLSLSLSPSLSLFLFRPSMPS